MGRLHKFLYLKDEEGIPISDANLNLYLTGTQTEAKIYSTAITNTQLDQLTWTTNSSGFFDYYIGNEWASGGYDANQYFDLVWSANATSKSGIIEKMQMFPFLFSVDETDNTSSTKDDKNKLLSNELAYKIEYHVDHDYPVQPHGIKSVNTDDPYNSTYDKVVTNELMNRIDNLLDTLLTCGGDAISISATGSLVDSVLLDTFTASGDGYYTDLAYSIKRNRMFPLVQFYEYYAASATPSAIGSNQIVHPRDIQNIDTETLRVWTNTNAWLMATVVASGK